MREYTSAPVTMVATDRFTERGLLGRGGSSVVVRAFDKDLLREVALKVLATESSELPQAALRFSEEAQIAGQLEHPNIVPVYELATQPSGQRFLSMRLLEGHTLEETLRLMGASRLDPDHLADLLHIFVKVCEAIAFAHSRGVIHRDLKPANIMTSDFGQVYVLDWGIAQLLPRVPGRGPSIRLTPESAGTRGADGEASVIGTPSYMAPEQFAGARGAFDERTDVFALGGTLFQILTGQPPLSTEIIRALYIRGQAPPIMRPEQFDPNVPPELSRITMRALAYDPVQRYASVGELKCDIESFQRGSWHLPRVSYCAGTIIVKEGEIGNAAYVIEQGRCRAYRTEGAAENELRVMGPGEVFGETAVFCDDKSRTASVKALTDVRLLVVTSEVLARAVGLNLWMGAFVKAIAARFREADERLRVMEASHGDSK